MNDFIKNIIFSHITTIILSCFLLNSTYCFSEDENETGDPDISYEDRVDILDLISRYAHYIDTGETEAWTELFTTDGEFIISDVGLHIKGRKNLLAWIKNDIKRPSNGPTLHFVGTTILVKIDNKKVLARSKSIVAIEIKSSEKFPVLVSGVYEDTIVKTKNGWKFLIRSGSSESPISKEFLSR